MHVFAWQETPEASFNSGQLQEPEQLRKVVSFKYLLNA